MSTTLATFLASLPAALNTRAACPRGKDLAARIRGELKLALKAGVFPAGTELAVSLNRGGHTTSINVEIVRWEGAVFCEAYMAECMAAFIAGRSPEWRGRDVERYAAALSEARRNLEAIARRHNYDNSQIETDYFDVGYYLHVRTDRVEASATTGIRCEVDPAFAELHHRAVTAAASLPKNLVKYYAPDGVENAGEYTLGKIIAWSERAAGRPIVHSPGRGWHVAEGTQAHAVAQSA